MRLKGSFIDAGDFKSSQIVNLGVVVLYLKVEADCFQLVILGIGVVLIDHAVEGSSEVLYFKFGAPQLRFSFG